MTSRKPGKLLNEVFKIDDPIRARGTCFAKPIAAKKMPAANPTEKEQLYGSALKAYNNGEISTALSKLERLLDLGHQTPDASVPDRDSVYQGFYNQIRSERDSIHNAYEEGSPTIGREEFHTRFRDLR